MARTVDQIYNQNLAYLQTNYGQLGQPFYFYFNDKNNNPITPSKTSFVGMMAFTAATCTALFEQENDVFIEDVEAAIAMATVYTAPWIQKQLIDFQYSATSPQVVQFDPVTFALSYPSVNPALRVISQASAQQGPTNRNLLIKVATGAPPAPLSAPELAALNSYLQAIMIPGTQYSVISTAADKIFLQAQVYYDATYSGVIQATMVAAMNAFLAGIPFNGTFTVNGMLEAMLAVPGVKDVVINNMRARLDTQIFPAGTNLVLANDLVQRNWETYAGYAVGETTAGNTFNDTITYIAA